MMISVLLVVLTVGHLEAKVPTSDWASVYTSDNTDYRQPVSEASVYPIAQSASRSDWFESYPYQKFEEKTARMADPGILETIGETVGSMRNGVSDFGGGIVNGALRLVGAETLREKQEKARQGLNQRGQQFSPSDQFKRDTLGPSEANAPLPLIAQPEQAPLEKLRLGIRSYLDPLVDPVVDPIKNLLKSDTKIETQHDRRAQQAFPNPISGLKDFGKHVAGGFSKLTGISASSKVSNMLFPWLKEETDEPTGQIAVLPPVHNTQARQIRNDILSEASAHYPHQEYSATAQDTELPLLPPVFIFPPSQVAQDSNLVEQRVPAPSRESIEIPTQPAADVFETFKASKPDPSAHNIRPPAYPKKTIYPPMYPQYKVEPPPYHPNEIIDAPYPYHIMITPIVQKHLSNKHEIQKPHYPSIDQIVSGSSRSLTKDLPQLSEPTSQTGLPLPFNTLDVMYYLPAPDLSSGDERENTYYDDIFQSKDTILYPETYFSEENSEEEPEELKVIIAGSETKDSDKEKIKSDLEKSAADLDGTNIEIDLSTGVIDGVVEPDDLDDIKTTDSKAVKKVRKQKLGKVINLQPEDTLVFDISQQWGDKVVDEDRNIKNTVELETDETSNKQNQDESHDED